MSVIHPRYAELQADLEEIFAKSAKQARHAINVILIVGGLFIVAAAVCFLVGGRTATYALPLGLMGVVMMPAAGGMFLFKNPDKRMERARTILMYTPELLVWSYLLRKSTNGIVTGEYIVLKFRDKTEYMIPKSVLPDQDPEVFLQMLLYLNPALKLGYLDGHKQLYHKNQL